MKRTRLTSRIGMTLALVLIATGAIAGTGPQLAIQTGHVGAVVDVAWSPDGRVLASRGSSFSDGSVKVWDPASGRLLADIHPATLSGMRWSRDGSHIVVWEERGRIHDWNARTGAIDATFDTGGAIRETAWSPDGGHLAVAMHRSGFFVDARSWAKTVTLPGVAAPLRFSADGTRLFAGGVIWEASGERAVVSLEGFEGNLIQVDPTEWSPDGRLIASARGKVLRVWNTSNGRLLQEITTGHGIRALAWSPDGSMLAVGSFSTTVFRVTPSAPALLEVRAEPKGPTSWIEGVAWSRNGTFLAAASADGTLTIWNANDLSSAAHAKAHEKDVYALAWSPVADVIATASADANLKVWNSDGRPVATMTAHTRGQLALAWSVDSRFIAVGADDGPVRVWETESGQIIVSLEGEKSVDRGMSELWKVPALSQILLKPTAVHEVRALEWSKASNRLAVLATNGNSTIELWEPLQNRRLSATALDGRDIRTFAWSPDERRFAVGARAGKAGAYALRIVNASDGSETIRLDEQKIATNAVDVRSLAWSPDGSLLARSGEKLSSLLVDLQARQAYGDPVGGCCVAFSPDGGKLAAGGRVWDVQSRVSIAAIPADNAAAVAWSPDSTLLAVARDREVSMWDVATSRKVQSLTGHDGAVTDVAWSADGQYLITSSQDGSLRLWSLAGEMLATLLVLDDGRDWLATTPEGLFDGSPGAWKLVGWHADPSDYLRVDPVEIFFREYFYPGLLPELLRGGRPHPRQTIESVDRRQPVVRFLVPATAETDAESRTVEVKIEINETANDSGHPSSSGARDVRLFRNGSLVAHWSGDVLKGKNRRTLSASIPVVAGENRLTAYAFNASNIKSEDASAVVRGSDELARKGRMRIVAVGVNRYANDDFDLRFARADAEAFGEELKQRQLKLGTFEGVDLMLLSDASATKDGILGLLRKLGEVASPEDAVVVFFAGHGIAAGSRFYLVPHDLGYEGLRSELDRTSLETVTRRSVSDLDLEGAFGRIDAGQILLVIDACNSGQALESEESRLGPMNSKGLGQLAWEKGMNIVTAAQGYQAALEAEQLGHGLLTWALVEEGLKKGMADESPRDGSVVAREWLDFAAQRVPQLQEDAMVEASKTGREIAFVDGQEKVRELSRRTLQRPRVFYRREPEREPLVIARQ